MPDVRVTLFALAAVTAAVVGVYLWPYSGVDTDPPVCFNVFGQTVGCNDVLRLALPVVVLSVGLVAVIVLAVLWVVGQHRAVGGSWLTRVEELKHRDD